MVNRFFWNMRFASRYADTEGMERALGTLALLWGLWLLLPFGSMVGTGIFANAMSGMEPLWGIVLSTVGVLQLLGLGCNNSDLRRAGAIGAFALWSFVSLIFVFHQIRSLGAVFFPWLCYQAAWTYLRLRGA